MNMKCPICGSTLREGEVITVEWIATGRGGHWFFQHLRNKVKMKEGDAYCMQADLSKFFLIKATPEIAGSEQAE